MKKIICLFLISMCAFTLSGCKKSETFGLFTHNGYSLTTFKNKDLNYEQAEAIVAKNSVKTLSLTDDQVDEVMSVFNSVDIKVKYWNSSNDKSETRTSTVNGSNLQKVLKDNEVYISSGILVKNIYMTNDILSILEQRNSSFDNSLYFNSLYSYHKDIDEQLVIRSNDFQEITADVTGGIISNFIQQNESLYNSNNLISKFQSSFGMQFETLGGTQLHGTVLEVEFVWQLKS